MSPKNFTPVRLISFLFKTFERLIDLYIRNIIPQRRFILSQHAYLKGRSLKSDNVIHTIDNVIEDSYENKDFIGGAFFAIEGALLIMCYLRLRIT